MIRLSLKNVGKIIVLSEELKSILGSIISNDKIAVIPNGIPDMFDSEENIMWNKGKNKNILYVGNISREKGIFKILEIATELFKYDNEIKITISGPWFKNEDKIKCNDMIEKMGIKNRIIFTGIISGVEKKKIYFNHKLFLFPPTQSEGMPLTILEAMSAGLPIITTRQGAITDVVVNGINGYVMESDDNGQFIKNILKLINDNRLCKKMSEANRNKYLKYYKIENCVEKLIYNFKSV